MKQGSASRVVLILGGFAIIIWSLAPLYWGLIMSFTVPSRIGILPPPAIPKPFTWSFYAQLLNGRSSVSLTFLHGATNSIVEAGLTTIITVIIATLAGYGFVRYSFRGSKVLFILIIGTMSLPIYAILIPLYRLITQLHLANTYMAIIIINSVLNLPLAIWLIKSHVASLPKDIEEAARIDGAGRITLLLRIVVPLISPGMASVSIIVFLGGWAAFFVPLIFAPTIQTEPLTVLLPQFSSHYTTNYGLQAATGLLALIPPILVVIWFNKRLVRGLLGGGLSSS